MDLGGSLGSVEVYKRLQLGEKVTEDEWDYSIIPECATYMKKKYGVQFGKDIIPTDNGILDRLFQAGLNLILETGIFCPDMGRLFRVDEDEIWDGIQHAPRKVILGDGRDAVTLEGRHGSARRRPLLNGGPTAGMITESIYSKVMQSYAQERVVDTIYCGIMNTYCGDSSKLNTPLELYQVMTELKSIDLARTNAGRPGMAIIGPESALSTAGRICSDLSNGGMRPTDGHDIPLRNELKIDMTGLNAFAADEINGNVVMTEELPIYGGYSGGLEETAIVDVATHIAAIAVYGADFHTDGPIHIRWGTSTTRETLKILAHVAGAIDRNTNFLTGSMYYVGAGPNTEQCFYEGAAQAIVDAVTGREIASACASAKGVVLDKTTGLEARFIGKVLEAASGIKEDDANYLLDTLLKIYNGQVNTIPEGDHFQDCYNVETLKPTKPHQDTYVRAMNRLRDLGLNVHY